MSLTYATYITTIANLTVYSESDADFIQIMPSTIAYAENRIYRELSLLNTVVRDSSSTLTANSRSFTLPVPVQGTFNIIDGINVITPASASVTTGTRNPLTPNSRDWMDRAWPSETAPSASSVPTDFAMITDQQIIVAPPPGAAYPVEVIGFVQPAPLSATNTVTYLTASLPDLFVAASMVFMSGFMRSYGSQADDPKLAVSWEAQYESLMQGVNLLDAQQKFAAASWTSKAVETANAPQRG